MRGFDVLGSVIGLTRGQQNHAAIMLHIAADSPDPQREIVAAATRKAVEYKINQARLFYEMRRGRTLVDVGCSRLAIPDEDEDCPG